MERGKEDMQAPPATQPPMAASGLAPLPLEARILPPGQQHNLFCWLFIVKPEPQRQPCGVDAGKYRQRRRHRNKRYWVQEHLQGQGQPEGQLAMADTRQVTVLMQERSEMDQAWQQQAG